MVHLDHLDHECRSSTLKGSAQAEPPELLLTSLAQLHYLLLVSLCSKLLAQFRHR